MQTAALIATGLIGLLHVWILVLEMFLWSRAVKVFAVPRDQRDNVLLQTAFKNQGAYNGFLAAGCFWACAHPNSAFQLQLALFFLGCVAVAGVVGAVTANVRILFVQTVPAVIAMGLWVFA
ncbi:MAG: DUF1304 domain-containing protein [Proteobacteria bacterium]|nr:DUF1304 domain-containing protein [Pseudomonadota bacterium]